MVVLHMEVSGVAQIQFGWLHLYRDGRAGYAKRRHELRSYTVEEYTHGIHSRSLLSLPPVFKNTANESLVPDALPYLAAEGDGGTQQALPNRELSGAK